MEKNRDKIFDQRGELCNTIKDLFKNISTHEKFLPVFREDEGYCMDWGIIGSEYEKYFGWVKTPDGKFCSVCPDNMDWRTWIEIKAKIKEWIAWISQRLFHPNKMIGSKHTTDLVRLRIAVAMLDKIELPRIYSDEIFDNLIQCYWIRKYVYDTYYYRYILGVPF